MSYIKCQENVWSDIMLDSNLFSLMLEVAVSGSVPDRSSWIFLTYSIFHCSLPLTSPSPGGCTFLPECGLFLESPPPVGWHITIWPLPLASSSPLGWQSPKCASPFLLIWSTPIGWHIPDCVYLLASSFSIWFAHSWVFLTAAFPFSR